MSSANITTPPGTDSPPESLPPGTTIPPGLLQNGTAGEILGDPNAGAVDSGAGDGVGDNIFENMRNTTPEFLPEPLIPYEKASATSSMAGVPRFGHTNDFSYVAYLAHGDKQADGEDYILGLLFTGCFLLVFFLIWTLVLVVFKVAMTGFLCGDPFVNPHLTDPSSKKLKEDAEEDEEEYKEDTTWLRRPRRVRITFFICGFLQILFAILLVTKGVANLQETTDTVQVSTSSMKLLVDEALQVSQNLKQVGDTGLILRDQIVFDLDKDNFCPDNPVFAQTEVGRNIASAADSAVSILNQLGNFIGDNVESLEESLEDGRRNLDEIDQSIDDMESNEWLGGLVAFPYLILASLMMVGAIAAQLNTMTDCFLCVLNWVVLPMFIFMTILSYVALGVISIAASVNADFCGGESSTPDQVIVDLMFRSGFNEDDLFFQTVRYYAYQCTALAQTDPFQFLRSFDGTIVQGRVMVQNLTKSMDDISLEQLALGCNRDFAPLHRSLSQMVGVMDALLQASNRALKLLRCQQVVPVYTDIVYDATCTYSVSGFAWIFSSLLIMSIMGMVMIMFRSSYQNTIFESPPSALIDDSSTTPLRQRNSNLPNSEKKTKTVDNGNKGTDDWNDESEGGSR